MSNFIETPRIHFFCEKLKETLAEKYFLRERHGYLWF